jgi:TPR repeat protein
MSVQPDALPDFNVYVAIHLFKDQVPSVQYETDASGPIGRELVPVELFCYFAIRTLIGLDGSQPKAAARLAANLVTVGTLAPSVAAWDEEAFKKHLKIDEVKRFAGQQGAMRFVAQLKSRDYRTSFEIQKQGFGLLKLGYAEWAQEAVRVLFCYLVLGGLQDRFYVENLFRAAGVCGQQYLNGEVSPESEFNCVLMAVGKGVCRHISELTGVPSSVLDEKQRAAERGDVLAQVELGMIYERANLYDEALNCYTKAAEKGDSWAQVHAGLLHDRKKEYQKAAQWYRKAAEQGYPDGLRLLGDMYREGLGVARDLVKSVELLLEGAKKGDPWCQNNLAVAYSQGLGVEKDESLAFKWYKSAAEQGLVMAQGALGYRYYRGLAVKQNYADALAWFLKAAERGSASAQNSLGIMYEAGEGVAQDFATAAGWYKKAAHQGHPYAQHNLALLYQEGKGVSKNEPEALRWFYEAANAGFVHAQVQVAIVCEGLGDKSEARKWYLLAAEQGDEKAKQRLTELL